MSVPLLLVTAMATTATEATAQIPQTFENLRILPRDIARDSLLQVMRTFAFSLGVRCQHCHIGGDGVSFEGVNFASDEKAAKRNARFMMRMVDSLNATVLATMPDRSAPPVVVECVTCHRGLARPTTLARALARTIADQGVDSAVAEYRRLRRDEVTLGRYNFGEWSINELARTLRTQGKTGEAIAMLELNAEFYPASPAIDMALGDLHRERGERDKALRRYRMALEKQPDNQLARRRIEELSR